MDILNSEQAQRLKEEQNIWLATVRADGKPHLVPIWFVHIDNSIFICVEPESVKGRNIPKNAQVSLALEDGSQPLICEGTAKFIHGGIPSHINEHFKQKYDWDISTETRYTQLIEIIPIKWLYW